ncbi:MAG TPA: hypothetical protein DCQ31_07205 [Bacteroidales bacterium]|nr:hypothetical protein [Bacteroidales bacterium]
MTTYIFDACALIIFLQQEEGFEKAVEILQNPNNIVLMHAVTVGEVYYDALKKSEKYAELVLSNMEELPIIVRWDIDKQLLEIIGKYKVKFKMSYADSYVLAMAEINNAMVVSTDHHEFDAVEKNTELQFFWLR